MSIIVQQANLETPEFADLIQAHANLMLSLSPPGSCHFLPMDGLRDPSVSVWEMRDGTTLVGCGALKELSIRHGEVKSMHTVSSHRGGGLGRRMLEHILQEARRRGYTKLSLETGSMDGFRPSRKLYQSCGFEFCPPFAEYAEDPNSVYMTLSL